VVGTLAGDVLWYFSDRLETENAAKKFATNFYALEAARGYHGSDTSGLGLHNG